MSKVKWVKRTVWAKVGSSAQVRKHHKRRKYNTSGLGLWDVPRGWNI